MPATCHTLCRAPPMHVHGPAAQTKVVPAWAPATPAHEGTRHTFGLLPLSFK